MAQITLKQFVNMVQEADIVGYDDGWLSKLDIQEYEGGKVVEVWLRYYGDKLEQLIFQEDKIDRIYFQDETTVVVEQQGKKQQFRFAEIADEDKLRCWAE